jgi:hypothetical protein
VGSDHGGSLGIRCDDEISRVNRRTRLRGWSLTRKTFQTPLDEEEFSADT